MNCTRIETKLMAYLDGRSNARERREVEAHLKTCALCRERAEEFRSVSSLLEELPQIEVVLIPNEECSRYNNGETE